MTKSKRLTALKILIAFMVFCFALTAVTALSKSEKVVYGETVEETAQRLTTQTFDQWENLANEDSTDADVAFITARLGTIGSGIGIVKTVVDSEISESVRCNLLNDFVSYAFKLHNKKAVFDTACASLNVTDIDKILAVVESYEKFNSEKADAVQFLNAQIEETNQTFSNKFGIDEDDVFEMTLPKSDGEDVDLDFAKQAVCNEFTEKYGKWSNASAVDMIYGKQLELQVEINDGKGDILIGFFYTPKPNNEETRGSLAVYDKAMDVEYVAHLGTQGLRLTLTVNGTENTLKINFPSEKGIYVEAVIAEGSETTLSNCSIGKFSYVKNIGKNIEAAKTVAKAVESTEELRAAYNSGVLEIEKDINAVLSAACDYIGSYVASEKEEWFSASKWTEMNEKFTAAKNAILGYSFTANAYDAFLELFRTKVDEIKTYLAIDVEFRTTYGEIIRKNAYYSSEGENSEMDKAQAALNLYDGFSETIKATLENEYNAICSNYKLSAKRYLTAKANELYETRANDCAASKAREFYAILTSALKAIDAESDGAKIVEARDNGENALSVFVFNGSKTVQSNGNLEITASSNYFDGGRAELVVPEYSENDYLEKNKYRSIYKDTIKYLNVIEQYDITVTDNGGKEVAFDYETEFDVKIKLGDTTVESLKNDKLDPERFYITYVASDGSIEVYKTKLILKLETGEIEYSAESELDWDKVKEGYIMFSTKHFSSYFLMGKQTQGETALDRLTGTLNNLLADTEGLMNVLKYVGIALVGALVILLLCILISCFKRYKITYKRNGGSKIDSEKYGYGRKIKLPTITKEGFVFGGWYIDKTLKYEFNRKYMPRANVVLYAKWLKEEVVEVAAPETVPETVAEAPAVAEPPKDVLAEYYDSLRSKILSHKKVVTADESKLVEVEVLSKMILVDDHIDLFLKSRNFACLKDVNDTVVRVDDDEKFIKLTVNSEESYKSAIDEIQVMAKVNELEEVKNDETYNTTLEERLQGMAYVVKNEKLVESKNWLDLLKKRAESYAIKDKGAEGKKVVEIKLLDSKLNLLFSGEYKKYSTFCSESGNEELPCSFAVKEGDDIVVALELVDRAMRDNQLEYTEADGEKLVETESGEGASRAVLFAFPVLPVIEHVTEAVEQVAEETTEEVVEETAEEPVEEVVEETTEEVVEETIEEPVEEVVEETTDEVVEETVEEPVEEVVEETTEEVVEETIEEAEAVEPAFDVESAFKELRIELTSYDLSYDAYSLEEDLDGKLVAKLGKTEDSVALSLCFKNAVEGYETDEFGAKITVKAPDEIDGAKKAIADMMAQYGFERGLEGDAQEVELEECDLLGYKISFIQKFEFDKIKCMNSLREIARTYVLFEGGEGEIDKSLDGKEIFSVKFVENGVEANFDGEIATIKNTAQYIDAKAKLRAAMEKYGLEVDPDYVKKDLCEGEEFSYRIKF